MCRLCRAVVLTALALRPEPWAYASPAAVDGERDLRASGKCAADCDRDVAASGECAAATEACRRRQVTQEHLLLQVSRLPQGAKLALAQAQEPVVWQTSGITAGDGQWCEGYAPAWGWNLKACSADTSIPQEVKVLTYNLFWWNLFGPHFRNGNGGSAGRLIAQGGYDRPYDFMGFQECEDVGRVLRDAGLEGFYGTVVGRHAVAIAYKQDEWVLVGSGMAEVAEDLPQQWWGTRGALWARFGHQSTGKTVLLVNHHGPLPVDTGGRCGRRATAWNLLRTIATHALQADGIFLIGDFNAKVDSETVRELDDRLYHVHSGWVFGGVDHMFSNCGNEHVLSRRNLGNGGSDHDAIDIVVEV